MTDVCQIPLTRGKVALVDAADYERVAALEWFVVCVSGRWYATRDEWKPRRKVRLHRFILGAPPRVHVGFANGDSLDCRRCNLQMSKGKGHYLRAPQAEPYPRETLPVVAAKVPAESRYTGVVGFEHGRFGARIKDRGEYRWLGIYATARDAALAVNVAARLLRGHYSGGVNDVPPAVSLDDLEAVIRDLAGLTAPARPTKGTALKRKGPG